MSKAEYFMWFEKEIEQQIIENLRQIEENEKAMDACLLNAWISDDPK